jgi:hypothetical protein
MRALVARVAAWIRRRRPAAVATSTASAELSHLWSELRRSGYVREATAEDVPARQAPPRLTFWEKREQQRGYHIPRNWRS